LAELELLKDYPHAKHLTCIVTEKNHHDVKEVDEFARARGFIPVIGAYHWDVLAYGKADAELIYAWETAIAVFSDLLRSNTVPRGFFQEFFQDNLCRFEGKKLHPYDAGKYSIEIDASNNVSLCLTMPEIGNLQRQNLDEILGSFDRVAVKQCSDQSTCNILAAGWSVQGCAIHLPD
jgi:sulfatase maturation enzyme AslB (radical SAM superfamily)|tara:strand:- start:99 stop:629 length:531 start_codon:yes stop_codon:yes gene_type:complete